MINNLNIKPDIKLSVKQTFGIDSEIEVEAFSKKNDYVPEIDKNYIFDRDTTLAILSGFSFNKRFLRGNNTIPGPSRSETAYTPKSWTPAWAPLWTPAWAPAWTPPWTPAWTSP